jgi:hypothetical protein
MNIEREWARVPPRWVRETGGALHPFTLGDLVGDFNQRRGDPSSPLHRNRDDIVDWCAEQESDAQSIIIACASKRRNGKVHNHQSRVSYGARMELKGLLLEDILWLRHKRRTFEEVLQRIEEYAVSGIGPVTAYDVCTRVCAFYGLEPNELHLHAGCLEGLRALRRACVWDYEFERGQRSVPARDLPAELRLMSVDNVEDFLCVYRNVLDKVVM